MPEDLRLTPEQAALTAQELIDAGRPFHAHEVLEATWKQAPAGQRDIWKGLAQIAVGLTHARRGNAAGAVALLRRGASAVGPGQLASPGQSGLAGHARATAGLPVTLDLALAERNATALAGQIEASGLGSLTESDLRLRILR
jgi:uncharacterized protein